MELQIRIGQALDEHRDNAGAAAKRHARAEGISRTDAAVHCQKD